MDEVPPNMKQLLSHKGFAEPCLSLYWVLCREIACLKLTPTEAVMKGHIQFSRDVL